MIKVIFSSFPLRTYLAFMAEEYPQDIMLVEVAYNWRRGEYPDNPGPFPEKPEGQAVFLAQVDQVVRETPHGRGKASSGVNLPCRQVPSRAGNVRQRGQRAASDQSF
jgi:hypothetical protein